MGPSKGIGSFSRWNYWAHSWPSTIFFSSNNGPMQGHRQNFLVETLGPFVSIGNTLNSDYGPMQGYRQLLLVESLGPFVAIGRIFSSDNGCSGNASALR